MGRTEDEKWMRRALDLAARGKGETNPNPVVGCVIVKAGRVMGEGFHARAGGPHAEVVALRKAGRRARGATLFVTLEPCAHAAKRTPPCVPALLSAGLRRVVVALRDPNPQVNGRGVRALRRTGLEVDVGVLQGEARRQNAAFVVAQVKARPYILLKAAMTLDGRIATARGDSKWITGPRERAQARRLRRIHDAVLVGIGTVLADDPLLLPAPRLARPFLRVILDSRLRLPRESRLVRSAAGASRVLVLGHENRARREALEAQGVLVRTDRRRRGPLDLRFVLRTLWGEGVRSVMVEGGSEVLGSFLAARLFDEVALFRAPLLLGGRGSRGAFGGKDPKRIADALRLEPAPAPRGARYELWRPTKPKAREGNPSARSNEATPGLARGTRISPPMFTGIVEEVGRVVTAERKGDVVRVRIAAPRTAAGLPLGGSVAVGGCCLTAVAVEDGAFECDLTEETLRRTAFEERLRPGRAVNLERPMKADGRFDGHIVQGHVDAVGRVRELRVTGQSAVLQVDLPPGLERYVVTKGSIAVDGVSLTVADLGPSVFAVAIIPYTLEKTSLRDARVGEPVNLEADVIAKYVERLLASGPLRGTAPGSR